MISIFAAIYNTSGTLSRPGVFRGFPRFDCYLQHFAPRERSRLRAVRRRSRLRAVRLRADLAAIYTILDPRAAPVGRCPPLQRYLQHFASRCRGSPPSRKTASRQLVKFY